MSNICLQRNMYLNFFNLFFRKFNLNENFFVSIRVSSFHCTFTSMIKIFFFNKRYKTYITILKITNLYVMDKVIQNYLYL